MKAIGVLAALTVMTILGYPQTPAEQFQSFTARLKARYWTESGRTTERSTTFVRATDGSWAFESDTEDPVLLDQAPRGWFRYTLDVKTRRYIISLSFVHAAVVRPIVDAQELQSLRGAYGTCDVLNDESRKQLGRSTFLGVEVVELEERDEHSVAVEWVAPPLQCFALKRTDVIDGNLRERVEAVSVQTGEPTKVLSNPQPDSRESVLWRLRISIAPGSLEKSCSVRRPSKWKSSTGARSVVRRNRARSSQF